MISRQLVRFRCHPQNPAVRLRACDTASRSRRSSSRRSSSIVYPEEEDVGKPKMFARQSFVVSGEEEEMAETILKARMLGEKHVRLYDVGLGNGGVAAILPLD